MATAVFVSDGSAIDYVPVTDVAAGDVITYDDMCCIAYNDIAADEKGALSVVGIFNLPKVAAEFAVGDKVYWDEINKQVTAIDTQPKVGKVVKAAALVDTHVHVNINTFS